jgi:HJR/Mrr/RecB family endonuclease
MHSTFLVVLLWTFSIGLACIAYVFARVIVRRQRALKDLRVVNRIGQDLRRVDAEVEQEWQRTQVDAEQTRMEVEAVRAQLDNRIRELEQLKRDAEHQAAGWPQIDVMSGVQFEQYVAALVRSAGWNVSMTPATGDYGVDLIAAKDSHRVAIQCKRLATAVGISAVQQAASGAVRYRCATSMVVSNAEFTNAAKILQQILTATLSGGVAC